MYHHLLVYTVTLLGVFTTRWRKKAGWFLDVFFPFVIFAGLSFRLWVAESQSTSSFSFTLHILFFEGGRGWEIFHLVLHLFHMWGFQMKPNLALLVQKLFKLWQSSGNKFPLSQICIFFKLFLHFVFTPRDIKEYLSDIRWRLFTYFCNATISERLTRQSRVPISIC